MITDYTQRITESPEELLMLSKDLRGKRTYPRVRMLWLLKTGTAKHITDCVPLLGFSWVQLERWWLRYQKGGLALLLKEKPAGGRPCRVTKEALAALESEMKKGTIATQREVRLYLKEHWGIVYRSDSTICRLFQRLRIRKKTGRKQHPKGDECAQQAFKDEFAKRLETHKVERVFALDESRFGLMTWFRRRWRPLLIPSALGRTDQKAVVLALRGRGTY
jgi:transposase